MWSRQELSELLGDDAGQFLSFWGVTTEGNFEGSNILYVPEGARTLAPERITEVKRTLYEARAKRVWPARDEKILASWNGLMLRAVAEGARAFASGRYLSLAVANGEFLFREMVRDDRVLRSHKDGTSRIAGYLEDHAAVGLGALALYELTFDRVWLDRARKLAAAIVRWFWDETAGMFFDTAGDHEALLTRPRDLTDNATPSGTSLAVELMLRLGALLGDADLLRRGAFVLDGLTETMARYPLAFGHLLSASDI